MRLTIVGIAVVWIACCFCSRSDAVALFDQPSPVPSDADLVRYAKRIDVRGLDSSLGSRRLEDWLLSGPPHLKTLEWQKSDCDIKPDGPEPREGWPLCVKVIMRRSEAPGWLVLMIGTTKAGIQGPPRLRYGVLIRKTATTLGPFVDVGRLSNLPQVISHVEREDRRAADRQPEDILWLYRLDPRTETSARDRDRTDSRFFHGLAIVATAKAFDPHVRAALVRLAGSAKSAGTRSIVREGDFGFRVALNDAIRLQDVIVCFYCRPATVRFAESAFADEREIPLIPEQERLLRTAFERYGHW